MDRAIPLVKVNMPDRDRLIPALEAVLYSGMIAEGDHVRHFETRFANSFGLPNAIATSSGTAALHLALILSGVSVGDEVITTSLTAEPTNTVIRQCGAKPVFADIDAETGTLCPTDVSRAITHRTKAIVVVHYAGFPADLKRLRAIADQNGLSLIEDAAHSLGARYGGSSIGTIGDFGVFSFQAIKQMTTIDGGMLTLRRSDQSALAKQLRWFGMQKGVPRTDVDIVTPGFKYNMNNVTASIGLTQLDSMNTILQQHVSNGEFYNREVPKIPGLSVNRVDPYCHPTYWLYTVLSDDSQVVEQLLNSQGVTASKLHRPNHLHSAFKDNCRPLPRLEDYYRRLTHIPCGWWVTQEDRERIVDILRRG